MDAEAVRAAYRRWAGVYDAVFGGICLLARRRAVALVNQLPGRDVLEVGVGTGLALPYYAADRRVTGIDLSTEMLAQARRRVADREIGNVVALREMDAEATDFPDASFDVAVAMFVASVVPHPRALLAEMRRVVRPGGVVAACTWSYGEDMEMLRGFWDAARRLDEGAPDEGSTMRYRSVEELADLWQRVGLSDVETGHLRVETRYTGFDDLWEPFTFGVGPAGAYLAKLSDGQRERVRQELFAGIGEPSGPFTLSATACAVRGRAE